jgi:hypothetical protein
MSQDYFPDLLQTIAAALPLDGLSIPTPKLPALERLRRRLSFRNERNFYHARSALSAKPLLTTFSPESGYLVLTQEEWWSDDWDAASYAEPLVVSQDFFEQFLRLSRRTPHCALRTSRVENSYFSNYALNLKDCYLVYGASDLEACLYSRAITHCRDVAEALVAERCELCYEIVACERCYQALYCGYCSGCHDCRFCWSCRNSKNCLLCVGLERAEYCIRNQYVGKEEYERFLITLDLRDPGVVSALGSELMQMRTSLLGRKPYQRNTEDCDGDFIIDSARCRDSSDIFNCENVAFLSWIQNARFAHDCTLAVPDGVQYCYQCCSTTGCKSSVGLFSCWNCSDSFYSMECNNCQNILGCVGLRSKEYCILNRQYSKSEYKTLLQQVLIGLEQRGQWGEYFPAACSWYGYNQTIAQEYLPLTANAAQATGYRWYTESPSAAPNCANDVGVKICALTARRFKLTRQEIALYEKLGLGEPLLHPDERHRGRIVRRYL